jgi:hypothetical protein
LIGIKLEAQRIGSNIAKLPDLAAGKIPNYVMRITFSDYRIGALYAFACIRLEQACCG